MDDAVIIEPPVRLPVAQEEADIGEVVNLPLEPSLGVRQRRLVVGVFVRDVLVGWNFVVYINHQLRQIPGGEYSRKHRGVGVGAEGLNVEVDRARMAGELVEQLFHRVHDHVPPGDPG